MAFKNLYLSFSETLKHAPLIGVLAVFMVAVAGGWLIGRAMRRGPATTGQALALMAAGLFMGLVSGLVMGSAWALLPALCGYMAALEFARREIVGPTVRGIRLDEPSGILALLLGRVFHGALLMIPLVFGTNLGTALSRALTNDAPVRFAAHTSLGWWTVTLLFMAGTAALMVLIALPGRTPPILGPDGKPLAGSTARLEKVRLGGCSQWIMTRGHSNANPVLLYLSGGPGQSDLPYSRLYFEKLTRHVTMIGWDQRGTGKSYAALDPTAALTLEQAVADTIELSEFLCQRYGQKKIYLMGESWGSTLGVLAVQRRPDLYYAWIGSGQMISQRKTDRLIYHDLIAYAEKNGNPELAAKMRRYGEPPYADIPYANAFVMSSYGKLTRPYSPPPAFLQLGTQAKLGPFGVLASEYNLIERVSVLRGLIDMFSVMYPQLQALDFLVDVPRLEVPVYLLDGAAELRARRNLALEWFEKLEAPIKRIFEFENAGHSVVFEVFEAFEKIMQDTILPETYFE